VQETNNSHLFKPGKSGNPRGRPKGSKNRKTELQEKFKDELTRAETQEKAIEVFHRITDQALDGCKMSQRLFVEVTGMNKVFDENQNSVPIININVTGTEPVITTIEGDYERDKD